MDKTPKPPLFVDPSLNSKGMFASLGYEFGTSNTVSRLLMKPKSDMVNSIPVKEYILEKISWKGHPDPNCSSISITKVFTERTSSKFGIISGYNKQLVAIIQSNSKKNYIYSRHYDTLCDFQTKCYPGLIGLLFSHKFDETYNYSFQNKYV